MASILVIDDERELRGVVVRFLEAEGHGVREASNGREGLEMFRTAPADLVITDIIMPEQEGVETIMELHWDFPDVPVIAMSGGNVGGTDFLQVARRLGARQTLAKPFGRIELLKAVREVLSEADPA